MSKKGVVLTLVLDVPAASSTEDALGRVGLSGWEHGSVLLSATGSTYSISDPRVRLAGAGVPSFQS